MINKLRVKLIVACMLSLAVILAVVVGVVSVCTYKEIVDTADTVLTILADNGGSFPDSMQPNGMIEGGGIDAEMGNTPPDTGMDDRIQGKSVKRDVILSPELTYESRYFTVSFSQSGNLINTNTEMIAAIDSNQAVEYAESAMNKGGTSGFIHDYRYMIKYGAVETTVIFLDCGRSLSTFETVMKTSAVVSAAGLLLVLLILIFLSGRIVKPFWENYEKQRQFITDAGHDLKTPLTVIGADAEVLEMDVGENEWLTDIKNQVGHLTEITNSLIYLSKTEETAARFCMLDFSISDVAQDVADEFRAPAKVGEKTLTADIQPMISMNGDEKAVRNLINILLDNALKYSPAGSDIKLHLSKQKNAIKLSVSNDAPYISEENLSHFFDRFYRTDESRNSQTGGHGLGLAIASAVVTAHKGKISASADSGRLTISVTFYS